jgi:hypothetical protein
MHDATGAIGKAVELAVDHASEIAPQDACPHQLADTPVSSMSAA